MSLDVYLIQKETCEHCGHETGDGTEVYSANITHNLTEMADKAEIYKSLWYPEEIGIMRADQLIRPLEYGLQKLRENPEHFKQFDASNGWGTYVHFVPFVEKYLEACKKYPKAIVMVSR